MKMYQRCSCHTEVTDIVSKGQRWFKRAHCIQCGEEVVVEVIEDEKVVDWKLFLEGLMELGAGLQKVGLGGTGITLSIPADWCVALSAAAPMPVVVPCELFGIRLEAKK